MDVREAVERGLDRGVRLSTDDLVGATSQRITLVFKPDHGSGTNKVVICPSAMTDIQPSRHEFISGSPSSVGSPTLAAERDALPMTGLPRLDTLSSPTMDRHVNVLKSMAHPDQTPGTHGAGLGLDLSSDMDPLGASSNPTELPAARRTLSSNFTASVAAPANVSSKAARLLGISDQRQNLQGRYTDEDVPPRAGRLLGLAPGSGAGADAGARAESRAAAGALPGTRRSASGRGGAGRIAGGRGGTGGSTDEDSEDDDGSSEGSERGAGGGDAKWVITDDD